MDIRIEATNRIDWIEMRDSRPTDDAEAFASSLRVSIENAVHRRAFWFDRTQLEAFLREASWVMRSLGGEATLAASGAREWVGLVRKRDEWWVTGEISLGSDAPEDFRFQLAVSDDDVLTFLAEMSSLLRMTVTA